MSPENSHTATPTLLPPEAVSAESGVPGESVPTTLTDEQLIALTTDSTPHVGPALSPPVSGGAGAVAGAVTATWRNNVTIDSLWSIDEARNSWLHIVGLGWRKIYNKTDAAFVALSTLAGQARQTNRPVSCREEADGMIYEIYVW